VTSLINLSETAFCKLFIHENGKTFHNSDNDIRISNVWQLLVETEETVGKNAYELGLDSQTYFNLDFLRKE
jgi:AraC-like DNA-binding protein